MKTKFSTICALVSSLLLAQPAMAQQSNRKLNCPSRGYHGVAIGQSYHDSEKARAISIYNLPKVPCNKAYIVLIMENNCANQESENMPKKFTHIEYLRSINGVAYSIGPRPPNCEKISLARLEREFWGYRYQVREIKIDGVNFDEVFKWADRELKEVYKPKQSDFLKESWTVCTGSYGETRIIPPSHVKKAIEDKIIYKSFLRILGIYTKEENIRLPAQVNFGVFICKGLFEEKHIY